MVVLPILLALQISGATLMVSVDATIEADCGVEAVYGLAGCYIPASDTIIVNSTYEWLWPETIPHEYAHRTVVREKLLREIPLYFVSEEAMAEEFAVYWHSSGSYSLRQPVQAAWFREHFIRPPLN